MLPAFVRNSGNCLKKKEDYVSFLKDKESSLHAIRSDLQVINQDTMLNSVLGSDPLMIILMKCL
jgi:hypothetical protein